jgi:protein-S-isoprenylcysteine O-methyltransferase Ste14
MVVLLFGTLLLLLYVKGIEEKELPQRFGEEYLEYKRRTPFLIPRFWKK